MGVITFNKTDTKSPSSLPKPGYYYGKIIEATMKQPKDITKNEYLNVAYELYDAEKNKCGRIYDIITDSDNAFVTYKLQRFGQALDLVGKSLALSDLPKVILNKVIIFKTKIEENAQYGDRAVVDISDEGIYYAKSESASFFDIKEAPAVLNTAEDDSAPFDVDDDDDLF